MKVQNDAYWAFNAYDLKNDGSFDYYWDDRYSLTANMSWEEIRPRFTNKDIFALTNNHFIKFGVASMELWNNTILVPKLPLINKGYIYSHFRMNKRNHEYPNGVKIFSCTIAGRPLEIVIENPWLDVCHTMEIEFRQDGNVRVFFNKNHYKTYNVGYTSFPYLENATFGDGLNADISIFNIECTYYEYTSYSRYTGVLEERFKERGLIKNISFYKLLNLPDYTVYYPDVYPFLTNYKTMVKYDSDNNGIFINLNKTHFYHPQVFTFIDLDKEGYILPSFNKTPSWRFYSKKSTFLKVFTEFDQSFQTYIYTPLEEIPNNPRDYCMFELRKKKYNDSSINNWDKNEPPLLSIYHDSVEYKSTDGSYKSVNINNFSRDRYLETTYLTFYWKYEQTTKFVLVINGNTTILSDLHKDVIPTSWNTHIMLFNGSHERLSRCLDLYMVITARFDREEQQKNPDIAFNEFFHNLKKQLINPEEENEYKNNTNLNKNISESGNLFDNIDSDGIIKGIAGEDTAIYNSKDWGRLSSYIPVPYERGGLDKFNQIIKGKFVPHKIMTKSFSEDIAINKKGTFDVPASGRMNTNFTLFYTRYLDENTDVINIKNMIFGYYGDNEEYLRFNLGNKSIQFQTNSSTPVQEISIDFSPVVKAKFPLYPYIINHNSGQYQRIPYIHNHSGHVVSYINSTSYYPSSVRINELISFNDCFHIAGTDEQSPETWINHFFYTSRNPFSNYQINIGDVLKENFFRIENTFKETWQTPNILSEYTNHNSVNKITSIGVNPTYNTRWKGFFPTNFDSFSGNENPKYQLKKYEFSKEKVDESSPYPIPLNIPFITIPLLGIPKLLNNDNYKIYGKVEYDGELKEGMRMKLVSNILNEPEEIDITYTDIKGEYEFSNDSINGMYSVTCEDLSGKYNTQIKDYTVWEDKSSESIIKTSSLGKPYVDFPTYLKKTAKKLKPEND